MHHEEFYKNLDGVPFVFRMFLKYEYSSCKDQQTHSSIGDQSILRIHPSTHNIVICEGINNHVIHTDIYITIITPSTFKFRIPRHRNPVNSLYITSKQTLAWSSKGQTLLVVLWSYNY